MSRLQLRGVIVPSDYDTAWAADYIAKGLITPESAFRSALAAAPANEPLEVYVNSPGGSVFAANEMVNAVRDWKMTTKQPVTVIVGAMAASAASAFTIAVADKVRAHSNAKMMFHGAWTVSIGGKEMHQDTADLLGKINADIKTQLVSKYDIAPETVSEWFAEGREGWLSAAEMKAVGIAHEIIGDPADAIDFTPEAVGDIEQRGLGIAAFLQTNTAEADNGRNDPKQDGGAAGAGAQPGGPSDQPAPAPEPAPAPQPEPSDTAAEPCAERIAGREEGRLAAEIEFSERLTALQARLTKAESLTSAMQGERDRAVSALAKANAQHAADLKEMSAKLKDAGDRVAKFLNGGLSFSPTINTWAEAMQACGGDYAKAAQQYPDLRREFNKQHTTTK